MLKKDYIMSSESSDNVKIHKKGYRSVKGGNFQIMRYDKETRNDFSGNKKKRQYTRPNEELTECYLPLPPPCPPSFLSSPSF